MSGHECDVCGREFDSKRGLSVHQSQKHAEEKSRSEENSSEDRSDTGPDTESEEGQTIDFSLGFRSVATLSFFAGFVLGGLTVGLIINADFDIGNQGSNDLSANVDVRSYEAGLGNENDGFNWEGGEVNLEDRPYIGDSDANVTIVSYEDFTCVFCARHNTEVFPQLFENEIEDGEVQYFYQHFPRTPVGEELAETSVCIMEQDEEKFWKAKEYLYDNFRQVQQGQQDRLVDNLIEGLDLDEEQLGECESQQSTSQFVNEDRQEGQEFDYTYEGPDGERDFVSGTPGFVVYDHKAEEAEVLPGALPYNAFQQAIDQ